MGIVFPLAAIALLTLVTFLVYRAERWRKNSIRELAVRFGCHYLGEGVPRSLPLAETAFARASKIWNVVDGEPNGIRIIFFDYQVGAGKRTRRRSVIAVERREPLLRLVPSLRDMHTDSVKGWDFFYRPRKNFEFSMAGVLPVSEIESFLAEASRAGRVLSDVKDSEVSG